MTFCSINSYFLQNILHYIHHEFSMSSIWYIEKYLNLRLNIDYTIKFTILNYYLGSSIQLLFFVSAHSLLSLS